MPKIVINRKPFDRRRKRIRRRRQMESVLEDLGIFNCKNKAKDKLLGRNIVEQVLSTLCIHYELCFQFLGCFCWLFKYFFKLICAKFMLFGRSLLLHIYRPRKKRTILFVEAEPITIRKLNNRKFAQDTMNNNRS